MISRMLRFPMAVRAKMRILAALAASLLLAGGFYAHTLVNAPRAHASTQVTGGLNVSVNPGSTTVGPGSVSTTVTYTCTDTGAPGGQAALRVTFDQNDNDASGEVGVACGSGDVNKTQTVTAVQVGMNGSQEVTAVATLDDGANAASDSADTVTNQFIVHLDPTATYPGDGTIVLTGFYNCASTIRTPGKVIVSADQVTSHDNATAGSAAVKVTTCNGTNQSFSVTITGSLSGDGTFLSDLPVQETIRSTDPSMVTPWGIFNG